MGSSAATAIGHRPTVATVDLEALRHNLRALRPSAAEVMAVVKANGYGHGAVAVARAALEGGATCLGVALVEEGVELRDAGLTAPIVMLSEFPPGSERDALAAGLTPTLYTAEGLARLVAARGSPEERTPVHVKIDTGMHRLGLSPERTGEYLGAVSAAGLRLEGLWTHFATADEPGDPFTREQLGRFERAAAIGLAAGFRPRYLHAANSAALLTLPASHLDLVRLGIAMYGVPPSPALRGAADLRPVLSWRSAVSLTKRVEAGEGLSYGHRYRTDRPSTVATVPVGYADGYARSLSGAGRVLIRGRRYPVAGTVTMDHILVDCGDDPVEPGDEVVLLGRQGPEEIGAGDLAEWTGTIAYEVVCRLSERVPRQFVGEP